MCGITRFTQFAFCNEYVHLCFVLAAAVEILPQTNSSVFISFLDTRSFYQHSQLTDE